MLRAAERPEFVPETRIGEWFQGTNIWYQYVVCESFADLRALLPAPESVGALMDAGCGDGRTLPLLAETFKPNRIIAVDYDPSAVARTQAVGATMHVPVTCVTADVCHLPLEGGAVNLIYCHQLLHHAVDPMAALRELRRVLAPGGLLLVSESCRSFLGSWSVRLFFRHPARRQQSPDEYVAMLREAGFQFGDDDWKATSPWWSRPDIGIRERLFGTPYRGEPTQVRIVARKPRA
jgi:SAM-dependent methyltransferase